MPSTRRHRSPRASAVLGAGRASPFGSSQRPRGLCDCFKQAALRPAHGWAAAGPNEGSSASRAAPAAVPRPRAWLPLALGSSAEHGAKPRGLRQGAGRTVWLALSQLCHCVICWAVDRREPFTSRRDPGPCRIRTSWHSARPPPAPSGGRSVTPQGPLRGSAGIWRLGAESPPIVLALSRGGRCPQTPPAPFGVCARDHNENGPQSLWLGGASELSGHHGSHEVPSSHGGGVSRAHRLDRRLAPAGQRG